MKNPFQQGQKYGARLREQGMLDANALNSTEQHHEDALALARSKYPHEGEEDQRIVAAGIMYDWQQHRNWR